MNGAAAVLALDPDQQARVAGWRAAGQALAVTIRTEAGQTSPGELFFRDWTPAEQTRRAAKWWAMLWGAGVCLLVVPLVHFVAPPLLFIAGPLVASKMAKIARTVFGGVGACPKCGQPLWIGAVPLQFPLAETCGRCYAAVRIEPASAGRQARNEA